jgi:glycosyltransferase involved in cell wall biosynthesis
MKIAIDARELQGKPTGVGRFLGELLAAWKTMPEAETHEFILLTPQTNERGTLWEQRDLPRLVRAAHADVLFSPGYTGPIRSRVPMVVAIHRCVICGASGVGSRGARAQDDGTVTLLAARTAQHIITISEFSKREIAAYLGVDPSKISVIYPGIAKFDGVPSHPSSTASPTVLFVGSIFNRRRVPELIEGFVRLARAEPNVRLEIVGENRTSPYVNLQALVQAASIGDRIHLRSYVPDSESAGLVRKERSLVFLSEYEGFGLTPLEALAAGIPVLLLDTPTAREVCGDAAVYLKRADPALIEQGLRSLLFDAATRDRIARASQEVLARYSWTDCARRVLEVLLEARSRGHVDAVPR